MLSKNRRNRTVHRENRKISRKSCIYWSQESVKERGVKAERIYRERERERERELLVDKFIAVQIIRQTIQT